MYANMNISLVILLSVFRFLDQNDLAGAAGACLKWWCVIKRYRLMEQNCPRSWLCWEQAIVSSL